jgi:hypothetical protein
MGTNEWNLQTQNESVSFAIKTGINVDNYHAINSKNYTVIAQLLTIRLNHKMKSYALNYIFHDLIEYISWIK